MPKDIRTALFKIDFFRPTYSAGYPLDAFYLYSDELNQYPPDALERELDDLMATGYVKHNGDDRAYWATREGKVAAQEHLLKNGILAKPLENQTSYRLADLVLAVLASNRVDLFSGSESFTLYALSICLHEFSEEAIESSAMELVSAGLVRENDLWGEKSFCLSGRGLQKYMAETRLLFNLGQSEGILSLIEARDKDARFSTFGFDVSLQENLEYRWSEMEACAAGGAYLAAVIILGSILEGALLAKLKFNLQEAMASIKAPKDKTGAVKSLDAWNLSEYISVSTALGYVPKSVEKHSHELRDTRNLVHPKKQVDNNIIVDESLYRISREIAETVIDALSS